MWFMVMIGRKCLEKYNKRLAKEIKKWSGKLIEFPYYRCFLIINKEKNHALNIYGENRIGNLKRLI